MMKRRLLFKVFGLLGFLATGAIADEKGPAFSLDQGTLIFDRRQIAIRVEIADTANERARGLMYRTRLAPDAGMLFVFSGQAVRGVWMKNTLLPLDILFLSSAGKIVSWLKNVPPCVTDPCEVYHSAGPVSYMLEVNAGAIDRWALRPGDKVSLLDASE
ncbi:MAG: DUF192 domain-containing protein [Gammaproteobacteria bacterium]